MPHHEPEKYLYDMLSSCEFLLDFRSAVERELQIIGEALIQLEKLESSVAARIPEYQNIIAFRHVLVHGYDSLDPMTVWNVIETKLTGLTEKIKSLLEECE